MTRVIERAVESLNDKVEILCLSGEAPAPNDFLASITKTFQPLEYNRNPSKTEAEKWSEELRAIARSHFGRDPDIWHIHNHSLGKNGFVPQLVQHLAKAGCKLLLQPHDFAEDGRPDNYKRLAGNPGGELNSALYPEADHVWYAPINYRDKSFLKNIGLTHVHELPNAVTAQPDRTAGGSPAKIILYPARAIRRKNIGEFLLWSLLAPEGYLFQSTLAPQNPVWRKYYDEWVQFADELNLPVEFDAGRKHDFPELVQHAEALISTSIAEGFGLAFLEPWLEGKPLIGRKLPEITADFEAEGLDLSSLYSELPVPLGWVGEPEFYSALESAMRRSYAAYSKAWNPAYFEEAKSALIYDGKIDFGILNEPLQRNVIRHLADNPADRSLLPPLSPRPSLPQIEHNRKIVLERYGLEAYGNRLLQIYRELAALKPGEVSAANAADLLNLYLKPGRFNLLRT